MQASIALIRRTLRSAARTRTRCGIVQGAWESVPENYPTEAGQHLFTGHVRDLRRLLQDPVFVRFEDDIETPSDCTVSEPLKIVDMFGSFAEADPEDIETYRGTIEEILGAIESYCSNIEEAAQRRLERANAMIGGSE
ncbi:hypothetical protein ACCS54_35880 [Rhizobium johnstonii]